MNSSGDDLERRLGARSAARVLLGCALQPEGDEDFDAFAQIAV